MKVVFYGLLGFAVLAVLLVVALLILPSLVDSKTTRSRLAAEISRVTGGTVEVGGPVDFRILPTPYLSAVDLKLSSGDSPPVASVRGLRARPRLGALLLGKLELTSVELIEPTFEFERLEDGRKSRGGGAARTARFSELVHRLVTAEKSQQLSLSALRIENGVLRFRSPYSGRLETVSELSADLSIESLAGPVNVTGTALVRGTPTTFSASIGRFAGSGGFNLDLDMRLSDFKLKVAGVVGDSQDPVSVDVVIEGPRLGSLISFADRRDVRVEEDQPFILGASVTAGSHVVQLENLGFQVGDSEFSGSALIQTDNDPQISIDLKAGRIQAAPLASMLPLFPATTAQPDSGVENWLTVFDQSGLRSDTSIRLTLSAENVVSDRVTLNVLTLAAQLRNGNLDIEGFSTRLANGSRLEFQGQIAGSGEGSSRLTYGGRFSLRDTDVRDLRAWAGEDRTDLLLNHLQGASVETDIRGTTSEVRLQDLKLVLDGSTVSGSATIPLRDRLSFGATIGIDTFNLDQYLPEGVNTDRVAEQHDRTEPNSSRKGPLAFLNGFDANLVFRAGSLRFRGVDLKDVYFNGSLLRGRLQINQAGVRGLAGASAAIKGALSKLEQVVPEFTGTVVASAENTKELFDFLRFESPIPPETLGPLRLNGKTEATPDGLSFEGRLQYAEIRGDLRGRVSNLSGSPEFRFDLEGQHPDLARLAALFLDDIEAPEGLRPAGSRLTVKLMAEGDANTLSVSTELGMTNGRLTLRGTASWPQDTLELKAKLKHSDFVSLVKRLYPEYEPVERQLGALDVAADLKVDSDTIRIRSLKITIGETDLSGNLTWRRHVDQPTLAMVLNGGTVPVDSFLIPGRVGELDSGSATFPPADWRWLSRFGRGADLDLDLRLGALIYGETRIDKARLVAVLEDEVLTIDRLAGTVFGGDIVLRGSVTTGDPPSYDVSIDVTNADISQAVSRSGEFGISGGQLDLEMNLKASGGTEDDLVASLSGGGRTELTNGTLNGLDLLEFGRRLGDFQVDLSDQSGGTTGIPSLGGEFEVTNGVAQFKGLDVVADGGTGSVKGSIDLSNWSTKALVKLRPAEPEGMPGFQVAVTGKLGETQTEFELDKIWEWIAKARLAREALKSREVQRLLEARRAREAEEARIAQEEERVRKEREALEARIAQEAEEARREAELRKAIEAERTRKEQEARKVQEAEQARKALEAERARKEEEARRARESQEASKRSGASLGKEKTERGVEITRPKLLEPPRRIAPEMKVPPRLRRKPVKGSDSKEFIEDLMKGLQ